MCFTSNFHGLDIKIVILSVSIILSNGLTIFLYLKSRQTEFDNKLNERLFRLQDICFNNTFLEDKKFINGWDDFSKKYKISNDIDYENSKTIQYLQYEQYCEMIFNLISDSFENFKSEDKILSKVAFKDWARVHKSWWKNPLDVHSNHDTYDIKVTTMIDEWIK